MRNTTGTDKETASEISSKRKTEYDILITGLAILASPFIEQMLKSSGQAVTCVANTLWYD